jgi:hypothetical protein
MRSGTAAVAVVLSALCAGCGSWTGGGFRAEGPEMSRLREVLALETARVVAMSAPAMAS